ncbi:GL22393 [Drosophila persimilis]|uniref:GL22393 n=1 Tax=Drosophila persimilis TaxID=7234 RepID=B4HCD9_DROPE|nr:GL22393 [Drosophila persimilis]
MGNPHNKKSNKKKCKEPGQKNKPTQKRTQEKEHVSGVLDRGISEVQKDDGVRKQKIYEDFVDFYEGAGLGPIQQRIFCTTVPDNVLADYEQTFKTIGKITEEMVDFRKYEVYVMLYPTLAIAYLQMVWSGKLQRAISFVGGNKHELDDSYKRRIEKLKLIRKPLDVPQRALELLSGADKVKFCMFKSTFNQFKVLEWQHSPNGHLKRDVIPDCPFDRKKLPSLIMNKALPSPNDYVTCATFSADHYTVAFGTSSGRVHVVAVSKDWQDVNSLRRKTLISAHQKPVRACAFSPGDSYLLTFSADRTMRFARLSMCTTGPSVWRSPRGAATLPPPQTTMWRACGEWTRQSPFLNSWVTWDDWRFDSSIRMESTWPLDRQTPPSESGTTPALKCASSAATGPPSKPWRTPFAGASCSLVAEMT